MRRLSKIVFCHLNYYYYINTSQFYNYPKGCTTMKKLAILLFLLLAVGNTQDITKDLKKLQHTTDEFTEVTTYTPHINILKSSGIYFYMIGDLNNITDARIVIQYYGKDWLFFNKMSVICDSYKNSYTLGDLYYTKEVLQDGTVLEKYDHSINTYSFFRELIYVILKSKTVKIRFEGEKYDLLSDKPIPTKLDFQLTAKQISTIKQYFSVYDKYYPIDTIAFNTSIGFKLSEWGESMEQVKSKEKLLFMDFSWSSQHKNKLAYDCKILGYDATLWYEFDESNKLIKANYIFEIKENFDILYKSIYTFLLQDVDKQNKELHCMDSKEKYIGKNLFKTSSWKTKNTIIDIMFVVKDEDSKVLCSISFKPVSETNPKKY